MRTSQHARTVDPGNEWEAAEWTARQDDREIVAGVLTQGLFARVNPNPIDVVHGAVQQVDLDRLEQAFGDLVVCFNDGILQVDLQPDLCTDPHVTCRHVHVTLRRPEWELVTAAAAAVLELLQKDGTAGAAEAVELLRRLAYQAPALSAAQQRVLAANLLK